MTKTNPPAPKRDEPFGAAQWANDDDAAAYFNITVPELMRLARVGILRRRHRDGQRETLISGHTPGRPPTA